MTTTHGGRREGAGRKPSIDAPIRRTVYMSQRLDDLITRQQQSETSFRASRSEALRDLLDELLTLRDLHGELLAKETN